jgi:hypothetical protein
MQENKREINYSSRLKPIMVKPSQGSESIENIDYLKMLKSKGWFLKERTSSGLKSLNRLTLFQWWALISGWILAIKAFVTVFLIDDQSEWNYYLGDFSPGMSKSIQLNHDSF